MESLKSIERMILCSFLFTCFYFSFLINNTQQQEWSHSLAAAFAFTYSLTYGACGHEPITLNLTSWNILIKACCYRGAIWRALDILEDTLPKNGFEPDEFSYNTILAATARVVCYVCASAFYTRKLLVRNQSSKEIQLRPLLIFVLFFYF